MDIDRARLPQRIISRFAADIGSAQYRTDFQKWLSQNNRGKRLKNAEVALLESEVHGGGIPELHM